MGRKFNLPPFGAALVSALDLFSIQNPAGFEPGSVFYNNPGAEVLVALRRRALYPAEVRELMKMSLSLTVTQVVQSKPLFYAVSGHLTNA